MTTTRWVTCSRHSAVPSAVRSRACGTDRRGWRTTSGCPPLTRPTERCLAWAGRWPDRRRPALQRPRAVRGRWSLGRQGGRPRPGAARHRSRRRRLRPARRPGRLPPARGGRRRRRCDHRGRPRLDQRQSPRGTGPRPGAGGLAGPARSCALGASAVTVAGPCGTSAALEPAPGGRLRLRPTALMAPSLRSRGGRPPPAADGGASAQAGLGGGRPSRRRRRRSWPGCCTPRPSCSSHCSVRSSRSGPGCPSAGRGGGADDGTRSRTRSRWPPRRSRIADAVQTDLRIAAGRPSRPGDARHSGTAPLPSAVEQGRQRPRRRPRPRRHRSRRHPGHPGRRRRGADPRDRIAPPGGRRPRPQPAGSRSSVPGSVRSASSPPRWPNWSPCTRRATSTCSSSPTRSGCRTGRGRGGCPHLDPRAVHVRTGSTAEDDEPLHAWLTALVDGRRAAAAGRPGRAARPWAGWSCSWTARSTPGSRPPCAAAGTLGIVALAAADTAEDLPVPSTPASRLGGETGDEAVLSRQGAPDHRGRGRRPHAPRRRRRPCPRPREADRHRGRPPTCRARSASSIYRPAGSTSARTAR